MGGRCPGGIGTRRHRSGPLHRLPSGLCRLSAASRCLCPEHRWHPYCAQCRITLEAAAHDCGIAALSPALVLMSGIIIDNAIVVLEHICRFVEEKRLCPLEAAHKASADIGLTRCWRPLSCIRSWMSSGKVGYVPGDWCRWPS